MEKLKKTNNKSTIYLEKTKITYFISKEKNIIQGSLESGIKLPYSCRSGICGTCKAKVLKGRIDDSNYINNILTEQDRKNKIILTCQSKAISDQLKIKMLSPLPIQSNLYKDMTPKEFIAEVITARQVTPLVKEIAIYIPKGVNFTYQAGMNLEFVLPGIHPNREYSIIDAPDKDNFARNGILRFLIACHKNSKASHHIKTKIKSGDILTLNGPFGNFTLPKKNKPILAISGGTGISPIISLLQEKFQKNINKQIMLVASYRNRNEILMMEEMQKLSFKNDFFSYKITLTRERLKNGSRFLYGRIPNIIQKIYSNLSEHNILIAGSPDFTKSCTQKVIKLGAKKKNIFIDCFNLKS